MVRVFAASRKGFRRIESYKESGQLTRRDIGLAIDYC
jgi:hypothetical protein